MAELIFHYGSMNSGKSTRLIQMEHALRSGAEVPKPLIVVKPGIDTKGDSSIVSRPFGEEKKLAVDILVTPEDDDVPEMDVYDAVQEYKDTNKIAHLAFLLADEGQFFTPSQVDGLRRIAEEDDTQADVFGIKTDYLGNFFPGARRLMEVANSLEKLKAWCRCGREAENNCRFDNGVPTFDPNAGQVAIENNVTTHYVSLCYSCFQDELTEYAKRIAAELERERALSA